MEFTCKTRHSQVCTNTFPKFTYLPFSSLFIHMTNKILGWYNQLNNNATNHYTIEGPFWVLCFHSDADLNKALYKPSDNQQIQRSDFKVQCFDNRVLRLFSISYSIQIFRNFFQLFLVTTSPLPIQFNSSFKYHYRAYNYIILMVILFSVQSTTVYALCSYTLTLD